MSETTRKRPFTQVEPSRTPSEGWHCTHLYYRFDRRELAGLDAATIRAGRDDFIDVLQPGGADQPERLQASIVSGHKADFGLMLMDPDPLKIDRVHQRLLSGPLGAALQATYSFVSISEVSTAALAAKAVRTRAEGSGM